MRSFFGNARSVAMELIHGFATDFQHALDRRSCFIVCLRRSDRHRLGSSAQSPKDLYRKVKAVDRSVVLLLA
jgi:hypothetical protein